MIKRSLILSVAASVLVVRLAAAQPTLDVEIETGVVQLTLRGDFAGSHYTIWRAPVREGPFAAITDLNVLCIGPCFGDDATAQPGATYWYRFDVERPDGTTESHGPFAVTIPAPARLFDASLYPNPARGNTQLELFYSGAPADPAVTASAILFDLQGRRLRSLWNGPLRTGVTRVLWDGRDDQGRALDPGQYYLRYTTPRGRSVLKVLRLR